MSLGPIKQLLAEGSVKQLIAGVDASRRLIRDIKSILRNSEDNPDVSKWIDTLNKLEAQRVPKRTVVGVFGNTGAGKSSLINAVLGEESLVPTNCMRACTAAVTELSWNDNDDPCRKYTAEVQFITVDEWATELRILFDDLADARSQTLGTVINSNSDAGIAMAKIRAVYPDIDDSILGVGPAVVDQLIKKSTVEEVLGVTKCFYADTAESLHEQLQPFVDAKQKGQSNGADGEGNHSMAVWPLVKVVRIHIKSQVLENGLVLVDLPGLHDSNAARAAVAENYKEQCSGYWIIAPITRGVDDKTAQNLMGDSFKRQLQLDGGISNVTIVYTKTDDISVSEALKDVTGEWKNSIDTVLSRIDQVEKLVQEKDVAIEEVKSNIKGSDRLRGHNEKRDQDMRERVYSPGVSGGDAARLSPRKCRLSDGALPEAKRTSVHVNSAATSSPIPPALETMESGASQSGTTDPLMLDIESLEEENHQPKQTCQDLKKHLAGLEKERKDLKTEIEVLKTQLKKQCILFRNNYSRTAAKDQFVRGIKELDDDLACEEDEENFDLSQDQRDYGGLARELRVFCVSSRAYLKLCGKLKDDEVVTGFETKIDTEIPGLQNLATELASTMRSSACRKFLNDVSQVLRSLVLRVLMNEEPLKLAANQKRKENRALTKNLDSLTTDFEKAESELYANLEQSEEYILRTLNFGCEAGKKEAMRSVSDWFAPRKQGGMSYPAFRNVCKGNGVNTKCDINLHSDMGKPLMNFVALCWEEVFGKNIFSALATFGETTAKTLEDFRHNMGERELLNQSAVSITAFSLLVKGYEQSLRDLSSNKKIILESQRAASRLIMPIIGRTMAPVYPLCLRETGPGCYMRIKDRVRSHVAAHEDMFSTAADEVQARIKRLISNLRNTIHASDAQIVDDIKSRYSELVKGKTRISKSLKDTLGQLRDLLDGSNTLYVRILAEGNNESIGGSGHNVSEGVDQAVVNPREGVQAVVRAVKGEKDH